MFLLNKLTIYCAICVLIVTRVFAGQIIHSNSVTDTLLTGVVPFEPPDYELPQVDITAARIYLANSLAPHQIKLSSKSTIEETSWAIRHLPGVFSVGYGGPGALQSISVGGGAASHTAVLLEGIPLNSPQYGSLDLSTIPMARIGRIDYLPHGGTSAGSGSALSGAVNLVPKSNTNGLTLATGSFGNRELQASLGGKSRKFGLALGQRTYAGDFSYASRGQVFDRDNNQFQQQHLYTNYNTTLRSLNVAMSYWLTMTDRGVPGSISQFNAVATQSDLWSLASIVINSKSKHGHHRWLLFHQQQNMIFDSPTSLPAVYGKHDLTVVGIHYSLQRLWTKSLASLSQIELRNEALRSTSTDTKARLSWSAMQRIVVDFGKNAKLLWTGRISGLNQQTPWMSGEVALNIATPTTPLIDNLSLISSTNLHQPTFNDLYWKPGGNLNLQPERSTMIGTGTKISLPLNAKLRLEYFRTSYTELITWSPDANGVWSASNLKSAVMSDKIITLSVPSHMNEGKLEIGVTSHNSENRTSGGNQGKDLRYNPRLSGNISIDYYLNHGFSWKLQGAGQSTYITYYNYPYDLYQDGKWSWNVHLSWDSLEMITQYSTNLTLSVLNATDGNLQTVPGYPEPGRTYLLTLQITRD